MSKRIATTSFLLLALPLVASAQEALDRARNVAGAGGINTQNTAPELIGNVISAAIALLGVVMVVLVIYAGFLYLTAGGDDEKVNHAKKILINSAIGLALTLSAYAITYFVVNELTRDRSMDPLIADPGGN